MKRVMIVKMLVLSFLKIMCKTFEINVRQFVKKINKKDLLERTNEY